MLRTFVLVGIISIICGVCLSAEQQDETMTPVLAEHSERADQLAPPVPLCITYPRPFDNLSAATEIKIAWESAYGDDVWYSVVLSRDGKNFDVELATKLADKSYVWAPKDRPMVAWIKVKAFRGGYLLSESVVPVSFLPQEAIIVSRADQKVFYIASGTLKSVFVCSTALPGYDIADGTYRVYLKAKKHWSKKWQVWMPYSLFFHEGYAIHATSVIRRLGRPASHGCVRLHPRDAERLYLEVAVGTPVLVLPAFQKCTALQTYFEEWSKRSALRESAKY